MLTHNIQLLMDLIRKWSDEQFSDGVFTHERTLPITYHLRKEVEELIDELKKVGNAELSGFELAKIKEEYADCFMLLLDSASHFGLSAENLYNECVWKLRVNKHRKWGAPDENGVIEHIRDVPGK